MRIANRNKKAWTEEQEDELRQLYMENQSNPSTEKGMFFIHHSSGDTFICRLYCIFTSERAVDTK